MITKSFGTLEQFKDAVEQRIDELEGFDSIEFSDDVDQISAVEGTENISLRQAKAYQEDQVPVYDDYEVYEDFDCATC